MSLRLTVLPAYQDNYLYVLDNGQHAIAIDPGDAAPVNEFLIQNGLNLKAIYNTHHHPDHIGGNSRLVAEYGCPVFASEHDTELGRVDGAPLSPNSSICFLDLNVQTLDVKAHTLGHIAYFIESANLTVNVSGHNGRSRSYNHNGPLLFAGDALFRGGCGRLFEGTYENLTNVLHRLGQMPSDTLVCCAHEYTSANYHFVSSLVSFCGASEGLRTYISECERELEEHGTTVPFRLGSDKPFNPFVSWVEQEMVEPTVSQVEHIKKIRMQKDAFA